MAAEEDEVIKTRSQSSNKGKPCGKHDGKVTFVLVSYINVSKGKKRERSVGVSLFGIIRARHTV